MILSDDFLRIGSCQGEFGLCIFWVPIVESLTDFRRIFGAVLLLSCFCSCSVSGSSSSSGLTGAREHQHLAHLVPSSTSAVQLLAVDFWIRFGSPLVPSLLSVVSVRSFCSWVRSFLACLLFLAG